MKKSICILTALVGVGIFFACQQPAKQESKDPVATATPVAEASEARGKYLVTVMGCNDCHSPKMMTPEGPVPDTARILGGHIADMPLATVPKEGRKDWIMVSPMLTAWVGPWGVSYTANISSDAATGIGNWTEQQFFKAMREGWAKGVEGGRKLLPPMPWQEFRHLDDVDLRSIYLYLQSTKPVKNLVPVPIPPNKIPG